MTSGLRCATRSVSCGERMSSRWNENLRLRCARASARLASDAGRQVVDDVDVAALGEQPVDERRADEPGAAGDHHAHRVSRPGRRERRVGARMRARTRAPGTERRVGADDRVVGRDRARPRIARRRRRSRSPPRRPSDGAVVHHRPHARAPAPTVRPRRPPSRRPARRRRRRAVAEQHRRSSARVGVDRRRRPAPRPRARARARPAPAAPPSAPASTSACAWRYFSGVPMSSQYASARIA